MKRKKDKLLQLLLLLGTELIIISLLFCCCVVFLLLRAPHIAAQVFSCINQLYAILNAVALPSSITTTVTATTTTVGRIKTAIKWPKAKPLPRLLPRPGVGVGDDAGVSVGLCMANELQLKFNQLTKFHFGPQHGHTQPQPQQPQHIGNSNNNNKHNNNIGQKLINTLVWSKPKLFSRQAAAQAAATPSGQRINAVWSTEFWVLKIELDAADRVADRQKDERTDGQTTAKPRYRQKERETPPFHQPCQTCQLPRSIIHPSFCLCLLLPLPCPALPFQWPSILTALLSIAACHKHVIELHPSVRGSSPSTCPIVRQTVIASVVFGVNPGRTGVGAGCGQCGGLCYFSRGLLDLCCCVFGLCHSNALPTIAHPHQLLFLSFCLSLSLSLSLCLCTQNLIAHRKIVRL